jgi:hypothetical protein
MSWVTTPPVPASMIDDEGTILKAPIQHFYQAVGLPDALFVATLAIPARIKWA